MTQLRVVAGGAARDQGQARPGLLDPQDQGHGDPAGDDRAAAGGGRPLRAALPVEQASEAAGTSRRSGPDWAGAVAPDYFNWRKISIYGGSNEIQRNIIAKAILGL